MSPRSRRRSLSYAGSCGQEATSSFTRTTPDLYSRGSLMQVLPQSGSSVSPTYSAPSRTSLGVESWVKPREAGEYIIRRIFVGPFVREFEKHGATLKYRLPGQFSEAYRLSPKLAPAVHLVNSAWFRSGIPTLAMGNIFVFCR